METIYDQVGLSQMVIDVPVEPSTATFVKLGGLLLVGAMAVFPVVTPEAHSLPTAFYSADSYQIVYSAASRTFAENEVAVRFNQLAEQWRSETLFSSAQKMMMNSSYQQIIGMGAAALPSILADLKRTSDHWFWALRSITGVDPAENTHDIQSAARAWLTWGEDNGLI